MSKQLARIQDLRPQTRNANKHTPRGLGALERSIQADGWIGAITVAADGETFDGSARIEVGASSGFDDAIVIHSDGTRPIVHVREDIPTADDPRAKRLGVAANRIAQLDFDPDAQLLAELAGEVDLSPYYTTDELAALLADVQVEPGGGGDDFDTTPADGPTRTQLGDLWQIGPHRLLVGDCTDAANVERLMGGERAALCATDPPYNVDKDYGEETDDDKSVEDYEAFSRTWLYLAQQTSERQIVTPGTSNLKAWLRWFDPTWVAPRTLPFSHSNGSISNLNSWEPIMFFGRGWGKRRANDIFEYGVRFDKAAVGHPVPKPVDMWIDFLENYSDRSDVLYEPFLGSGTTLIAAHRTGRRCYGMEISPRYADVILRRAEAEGLTCERVAYQENATYDYT